MGWYVRKHILNIYRTHERDLQIVTPSDIAIYGTLCALASLSRGAIEAQIMKGEHFASYLEQEPYVRELVNAYMSSKFKTVLEILDKYSVRCLLLFIMV